MNELQTAGDFDQLLAYLEEVRGFDFGAYKPTTLSRRIQKRMHAVGVQTYSEYIDYLQVHPNEFGELFNSILINVTSFFRDAAAFDLLRDTIVPHMVAARPSPETIRVWTAGCASGEEAYSIAMLLAEALGASEFRERVKIYATDIDDDALASARQAAYTEKQLEAVPADLRERYFDQIGPRWVVKRDYRRGVIFGRHDLLDDAPISRVDLLTCRNTLMYFNQEAQQRIVSRFHYALREGGFLLLGKAEMLLNSAEFFEPVDLKQRVFRRVGGTAATPEPRAGAGPGRDLRSDPARRFREIAFEQDPIAQVVVDAGGRVAMANARARDLFGLTPRDIMRPLQDLELSYRPVELRSCIDEARMRGQTVHVREVVFPASAAEPRYYNVQVAPMIDEGEEPIGTKIMFLEVTRQRELQDELRRSRQELETAYEELHSTNEELETTNEELQSTVEELETTNEELQSTNEELESMNEELESANEELQSVNEELRRRGIDSTRTNLFLSGILRSVPLGVVAMNADLHVELWNDVAAEMWGLRDEEVKGKHFLGLDIGLPVQQLRQPLMSLKTTPDQVAEAIVQATNRRGRKMTIRAVCTSIGASNATTAGQGVILLLQEIERAGADAAQMV
jgi:two-component system CheB/CheR fusion protein